MLKLKYLIKSSFKYNCYSLFSSVNIQGEIEAARVEKRYVMKNTAMFLITKTLKENNLKDKQFKLETNLNRDK